MRGAEPSAAERALLDALRAIPESPLRERVLTLVSELLEFAARPGCTETQADGVPCSDAQAACDECRKVAALVEGLRHRLQAG